jgi:hypothetical protein
MNKQNKFILATLMFLVSFSVFSALMIDQTQLHDNQLNGYIQDTDVYFTAIDGYSLNPLRKMQRITVELNDKTVTIQTNQGKEFYVKGQDRTGGIIILSVFDYALIQEAIVNLAKPDTQNEYDELSNILGKSFALLSMWPTDMPLLIWQNDGVSISAVNEQTVVDSKNLVLDSPIKTVDKSILDNPDAGLQFPEIVPATPELLKETQLHASRGKQFRSLPKSKDLGTPSSYDSSVDLCGKIGKPVAGLYPVYKAAPKFTSPSTPFYESVIVSDIERYQAPAIGGKQCLARCGGGCTDIIKADTTTVTPTIDMLYSNVYSEDCLDHDMCASPLSAGGGGHNITDSVCNLIFPAAANDLLNMKSCEHDLQIIDHFVSNKENATTPKVNLKSTDNLYVIYKFTNDGNGKLSHDNIFVQISVDGKANGKLTQILLADKMQPKTKARFTFPIGKLSNGSHTYSIRVSANNTLIESTKEARDNNDTAKGTFNVGNAPRLTLTVAGDGNVKYSPAPKTGNSFCTSATSPCTVSFDIPQGATTLPVTLTANNTDGSSATTATWSGKGADGCAGNAATCKVNLDLTNKTAPVVTATIKASGIPPVATYSANRGGSYSANIDLINKTWKSTVSENGKTFTCSGTLRSISYSPSKSKYTMYFDVTPGFGDGIIVTQTGNNYIDNTKSACWTFKSYAVTSLSGGGGGGPATLTVENGQVILYAYSSSTWAPLKMTI